MCRPRPICKKRRRGADSWNRPTSPGCALRCPPISASPRVSVYLTGWRKGAMCRLQWLRDCELKFDDDNDLIGGSVTLQAEQSKNKQAYTLPLRGELLEVIRRAW